MKKIISVILIMLLLAVAVVAAEDVSEEISEGENLYEEEFDKITEEDIFEGVKDRELEGSAGITPDSFFYGLESLVESVLVGDNPQTAMKYKEEKVLELQEMVNSGNQEAAEKALEEVEEYNAIIKKEVSPDIEQEVRASSKAVKAVLENLDLAGLDIGDAIDENLKEEDKIALAAKISNQIAGLCRALSNLDPLEYSRVCKTDDDSPKWKRDLDRDLTEEQEKEAKEFFEIMSQCFDNPSECRCDDISIKPFADQCNIIAPLAAECEAGDEDACEKMEEAGDPIDLLPDYLQDVMEELEGRYEDSKYDHHIPSECVEAGATSKEACMKVMFKEHAPPECLEALESGEIDPSDEREAREACEEIMFSAEAPQECIDAGLKDFRECETFMFKLDSPQECLDAGLTGSGRDDWKKCDAIRFKLDAPQECLDAGIDGSQRDDWKKCETIKFKLDSPQECLDAGLTGERNDWKKCNRITFLLDAPEECHQFADQRDPWKACQPIQFKLDAHPACLEAGLDGTGRRDWDECKKIQFKVESPQECLDAGLTGERRGDWEKCQEISEESYGEKREDCASDEMHVCDDNGYDCKCVSKEDYDDSGSSGSDIDCATLYCPEGTDCRDGVGCVSNDDSGGASCDDCASQCESRDGQRLRGTDCVNNQCQCYYESDEPQYADGEGPGEPGDFDDNGEAPTDGATDSETDGSSDGSDSGSDSSDDTSDSESSDSGSDSSDSGDSGSNTESSGSEELQ